MSAPIYPGGRPGWIEVITGSMFSGKSEELIRRLRRAEIANQKVVGIKPSIDDRFQRDHIVSHSALALPSETVATAAEILERVAGADVVGIDEAQFFGDDLVAVCQALADGGVRVIVAGLDTDYRGVPFEPIPNLLAVSEYITKTLAICMRCGGPANRSQRKTPGSDRIVVGAADVYEARCRHCFDAPGEEEG
jgi:thymidine kinase